MRANEGEIFMKEKINAYIERELDNILEDTRALIAIESVNGVKEKTDEALDYVIGMGKRMGFDIKVASTHDVATISYGTGRPVLGVLFHCDVVEPGELGKWTRPPYEMSIRDGKIYGRGISDDKGPAVMSLYALKFLKDNGIVPNKEIRLIVGTSEESYWSDIDSYKREFDLPDYGYSPDGAFPIYNREKGYLDVELTFEEDLSGLSELKGGYGVNSIPSSASCILNGEKKEFDGIGAHSSQPQLGKNAIVMMAEELRELGRLRFADFIAEFFGEQGEESYLDRTLVKSEEEGGDTTIVPTTLRQEGNKIIINFNTRARYGIKGQDVVDCLKKGEEKYGYKVSVIENLEPLFVDSNKDWLDRMAETYEEYGYENSFVLAAGCSYAKSLENFVSWGPVFPDDPETAHMEDEMLSLSSFKEALRIYISYLIKESAN